LRQCLPLAPCFPCACLSPDPPLFSLSVVICQSSRSFRVLVCVVCAMGGAHAKYKLPGFALSCRVMFISNYLFALGLFFLLTFVFLSSRWFEDRNNPHVICPQRWEPRESRAGKRKRIIPWLVIMLCCCVMMFWLRIVEQSGLVLSCRVLSDLVLLSLVLYCDNLVLCLSRLVLVFMCDDLVLWFSCLVSVSLGVVLAYSSCCSCFVIALSCFKSLFSLFRCVCLRI
jgi:hypothetical protein